MVHHRRLFVERLEDREVPDVTPVGSEFRANTTTTGNQGGPAIASDAAGNYVVVWGDSVFDIGGVPHDGSGAGIFGQRFNAAGVPQGPEFQVNTFTTGDQPGAAVAMDAAGNFVIAWQCGRRLEETGLDGSGTSISARRYSATGVALGDEFQVNSYTTGDQIRPSLAVDAAGNFVVAWLSQGQTGTFATYAQRFNAAGTPQGAEFRADAVANPGVGSIVGIDGAGNVAVAWRNGTSYLIQRFDAGGVALGTAFPLEGLTSEGNAISMNPTSGEFVAAWEFFNMPIRARRFDATGAAQGPIFDVSTNTLSSGPSIAINAAGDFVITWGARVAGSPEVQGRCFNADGTPRGPELNINTYTAFTQFGGSVAMDPRGNFVVVWTSTPSQDGEGLAVYGQRYSWQGTPQVTAVQVNDGAAQRSRVTGLTVYFNSVVTFAGALADAFTLTRIGGGTVGGFTAAVSVVDGVTLVTLSGFTGAETAFGSLADGRYQLTVRAGQVVGLDGNADGTAGDDFMLAGTAANGLYMLYGDANGDGTVNAADFSQFRGAFGTALGQPAYLAFLDFDGDGFINAFDFAQFRTRFGAGVP